MVCVILFINRHIGVELQSKIFASHAVLKGSRHMLGTYTSKIISNIIYNAYAKK